MSKEVVIDGVRYVPAETITKVLKMINVLEEAKDKLTGIETKKPPSDLSDKRRVFVVPDNIKISKISPGNWGDNLGIIFNDYQQHLVCVGTSSIWEVHRADVCNPPVPCECVPCNYTDLKPGDTAFTIHSENFLDECKNDLMNYCKILTNKDVAYISGSGTEISISSFPNDCWWRVIPQ